MEIFEKLDSSWISTSLGEITSSMLYGLSEKATSDKNGIPFIRITDIKGDGGLDFDNPKYVSHDTPNVENYQLKRGDILIARSGSVGLSYWHKSDDIQIAFASYLIRFRLNQELVLPEYLSYYFRSAMYWNYVERVSRGATILNINSKQLSKLPIPLPTISEQSIIVNILRKAEKLKELREILDDKIEKLKSDLFYDIFLSDQKRLNSWEKITLGKMATKVTSGSRGWGKYHSDKGARFIRVQDVSNGEINSDKPQFISPPNTSDKERALIRPNNLLITITGTGSIGRVAVVNEDISESYVSQHVALIELIEKYSPSFVSNFLNNPFGGQILFKKIIYGQTRPGVKLSDIRKIEIPFPPVELINSYNANLELLTKIIDNAKHSSERINDLISVVQIKGFAGKLTESFRKKEEVLISSQAKTRNEALKTKSDINLSVELKEDINPLKSKNFYLSLEQQEILNAFKSSQRYLLPENDFNYFKIPPNQIQRNLDLLAEIGLVKSVNIAIAPGETGNIFYTQAYRSLTKEDNTKELDLDTLEKDTKI